MGNFSRNTFKPDKNYVGVRLQQGVPLVDADWNELNDVIRNEVYSGLGQAFPDGVQPGGDSLQISHTSELANNLVMRGGAVLVGGRPLRVPAPVLYSAQPWFNNPTRADQDGVTVIPPLTTPSANRTDIVYLDVWEREVRSTEDTNLVHPAIGVETCVRLKREFAFRVAEGTQALPATPAGHFFMPLALLNRKAGQVDIPDEQIKDIRPKLFSTRGICSISFVPAFLPIETAVNPWVFGNIFTARTNVKSGKGYLPLVLPEGASLLSLRIQGFTVDLSFSIFRRRQPSVAFFDIGFEPLFETFEFITIKGSPGPQGNAEPFDSTFPISNTNRKNIVDNSGHCYLFYIENGSSTVTTIITRIAINYQY